MPVAPLLVFLAASLLGTSYAQLGYPGVMGKTLPSVSSVSTFKSSFYLYDSQPQCSSLAQSQPDGDCICVCHRYGNGSACVRDFYTLNYPLYSNQPSCQPGDRAVGECQCSCRTGSASGQCISTLPPAPPTPPPPAVAAPGPRAISSMEYEGGMTYDLPLTNLSLPGTQTRTDINAQFPGVYFEEQGSSGRRKLAQTLVTGQGGWTMFSTDSGVTVIHAVPIPNGQVFMYERNGNREQPPLLAVVYNLNNNTYRQFALKDSAFCGAHIMLANGKVAVIGGDNAYANLAENFGDGRFAVRIFTPGSAAQNAITVVANMDGSGGHYPCDAPSPCDENAGGRWYPSLTTLQDGQVLITSGVVVGGGAYYQTNPTGQIFNPANNVLRVAWGMDIFQDPTNAYYNIYPFTAVLPNGYIIVIAGRLTYFYSVTLSTGQITKVTNYKTVALLPFQVTYPQTASIHLLPLSPADNYNPQIIVLGGSSTDGATATTPATPYTYRLNLADTTATLQWTRESMSCPRIMPDGVLLPDGTLGIFNGGEIGVAGANNPGSGEASSLQARPQRAEIYNPTAAVGARFSGLLATSGRDRLYHSQAWLTQNAEVLITGSEATEDYTIQIFTPPYLTGTFSRPVITNPSATTFPLASGYNQVLTFTLGWTPNNAGGNNIVRVVFSIANGITHSTHFDERMVVAAFTSGAAPAASATTLSIRTPLNANVAPPGNYLVFAVSNAGRPSQGVYIGLGGAAPAAKYYEPLNAGIIADGTYTIQSTSTSVAACKYLGIPACTGNDLAVSSSAADTWNVRILRTAPDANTYNIISTKRTTCDSYLASFPCDKGTAVDVFTTDDNSGRQKFTLQATTGGYYIREFQGRNGCAAANYVTAGTCANPGINLAALGAGPQVWNFVASGGTTQPFANGLYTIANTGRSSCASTSGSLLSLANCGGSNDVAMGTTNGVYQLTYDAATGTYTAVNQARGACYNYLAAYPCGFTGAANAAAVTSYNQNDGTGRQRFQFVAVTGGYNILLPAGRDTCTQPNYVTAQTCATGTAVTFGAAGAGLQVFSVTAYSTTPAPATQALANGKYVIQSVGRSTACAGTSYLSIGACGTSNDVALAATKTWQLTYLPNAAYPNTYNVEDTTRANCYDLLAAYPCGYPTLLTTYDNDDFTGRQQFQFLPVTGGYNIVLPAGREGCAGNYATADACTAATATVNFGTNSGSNLQLWSVTLQSTTTPVPNQLANGVYTIALSTRTACDPYITIGACGTSNDVALGTTSSWRLTLLPNAANPYTYQVQSLTRAGSCYDLLAAYPCAFGYGNAITTYNQDDNTGRQQFQFIPVAGGYNIVLPNGRAGCAGFYVTGAACGAGTTVTFQAQGAGPQLWTVAAVTTPSSTNPPFPSGYYTIASKGRTACAATQYLSAPSCSNGNAASLGTADSFYLSYSASGTYAGTYTLLEAARTGSCANTLTAAACSTNTLSYATTDSATGLSRYVFTQQADGSYTIQVVAAARPSCNRFVSTVACGTATVGISASDTGSGYERWAVTAYTQPQAIANGQYQIANTGRSACTATQYLYGPQCTAGHELQLNSGGVFTLTYLATAQYPNTYNVVVPGRAGCNNIVAAYPCYYGATSTNIDTFNQDDGTGRQQFRFTPVAGGYQIDLPNGRAGCETVVTAAACGTTTLGFATAANGALSTWSVTKAATTATAAAAASQRLFADGDYRITNVGGKACANYLSGAVCTSGDTVGLAASDAGTGQVWTLTYSTSAVTANTYDVQCKNRNACNSFLSAPACTATGLGFAATDSGSGLQQWQISAASSGYTIQIVKGRESCTATTYLSVAGCSANPNAVLLAAASANSQWNVVAVNAAAG